MTEDELERNFLRPFPPGRIDELSALASDCDGVNRFATTVGEVPWPHPDRRFVEGRRRAPTDVPSRLSDAVLYTAAATAMAKAEVAARTFAIRYWSLSNRRGAPPTEVHWMVSSWGTAPGSFHRERPLSTVQAETWMAGVGGRPDPAPGPWTASFRTALRHLCDHRAWEAARARGHVTAAGPAEALVALWGTGCGIDHIDGHRIRLFVPEARTPATRLDRIVRPIDEQTVLDAMLCRLVLREGSTAGDLGELLKNGADPDATVITSMPTSRWQWRDSGRVRLDRSAAQHWVTKAYRGCPPPLGLLSWRSDRHNAAAQVKALLNAGAHPGRFTRWGTALNLAARPNAAFDANAMIAAGIPPNTTDHLGRTALFYASGRHGLRHLLEAGLDPNHRDDLGDSFLDVVLSRVYAGWPVPWNDLAALGVNLHAVNGLGETLYHQVARRASRQPFGLRRPAGAPFLVAHGVRNRPDVHGNWPDAYGAGQWPDRAPTSPASLPHRTRQDWARLPEDLLATLHRTDTLEAWGVVADWLIEQGDPRGPVLSTHLAPQQWPDIARVYELETRQWEALREAAPLAWSSRHRLQFRRGVVHHATLATSRVADPIEHLGHPVLRLLDALTLEVDETFEVDRLSVSARSLHLTYRGRRPPWTLRLPKGPHMRRLTLSNTGPVTLDGRDEGLLHLTLRGVERVDLEGALPHLAVLEVDRETLTNWAPPLPDVGQLVISADCLTPPETLLDRLPRGVQRLEVRDASQEDLMCLRTLAGALGRLALHVRLYGNASKEERTQLEAQLRPLLPHLHITAA